MEKDTYTVEVREATRGGDDYAERDEEFNTPEEVRNFIKNDLCEGEHVHSVLFYPAGTDCDPQNVTRRFK